MVFERDIEARIAGVAPKKFSRLLEGAGSVIAAKFRPGGFYPFVNVSISTFTGATVSVRKVFGADGSALEQAVSTARDDQSRIVAIEDFLRRRKPEPDEHVARISEIVYAAAGNRRILRVEDLVDFSGVNKRTLQRLFAKYVGVGPKWVIQRYRLHEAAERLASKEAIPQSLLALELGYSDQAHFVRDFTATIGMSPAAYARNVRRVKASP